MFSSFQKLDLFHTQIKLYKNGEQSYQTYAGSFISLLIIITTIIFTYLFGKELNQRQLPTIIRSSGQNKIPPVIDVNAESFPFLITLADYNSQISFADDKAFQFIVLYTKISTILDQSGVKIPKIQTQQFDMVQCDVSQLQKNQAISEVLPNINLENFRCLPQEQSSFKFGGSIDFSEAVHFLEVDLLRCDSNTNECYDSQKIDNLLQRATIHMYFQRLNVNPTLKNPVLNYSKLEWFHFSKTYKKSIILKFQPLYLNIDVGYMLEDQTSSDYLSFAESSEMIEYLNDPLMIRIAFTLDTNFDTITIKYQKIQEVIAEVGGFINILVIIAAYIVKKIKNVDYITEIIDDVFYLKQLKRTTKQENYNNNNKEILQQRTMNNSSQLKQDNKNFQKEIQIASFQQESQQIYPSELFDPKPINSQENQSLVKEKQIQTTEMQKLRLLLGCQDRKKHYSLYQSTEKYMQNKLDIVNLLQQLDEIELMKYLLFDQNQLKCINNLEKNNFILINDDIYLNQNQNSNSDYSIKNSIYSKNIFVKNANKIKQKSYKKHNQPKNNYNLDELISSDSKNNLSNQDTVNKKIKELFEQSELIKNWSHQQIKNLEFID